uniref:Uncharacterized protein n=1 Tax=Nelumbo nucifera TaxID=4432 RepID=A0A822YEX7_NELNU|nr:TPA_asm: hypothetical protein HUJ06_030973 [Nelumbo nucifera]
MDRRNKIVEVLLIFVLVVSVNAQHVKAESILDQFLSFLQFKDQKPDVADCIQNSCLPSCMAVPGATNEACKKECRQVCASAGSNPGN